MKRLYVVLLCLAVVGCKDQQAQTVDGAEIVKSQVPRCLPNQYLNSDTDGVIKCIDLPSGIIGQQGPRGEDGFSLRSGPTNPTSTQGKDGDTYIQMTTGDVFYKDVANGWIATGNIVGPKGDTGANGQDGVNGSNGTDGQDGLNIYSDSSDPSLDAGKNGDTFINSVTGDVFRKVDSAWVSSGNLKGPSGADGVAGANGQDGADGQNGANGQDGQNGKSLLVGENAPTSADGTDGDSFIDKLTADLWNRVNGTWQKIINLIGPKGDKGEDGLNGENGIDGVAGSDGAQGLKGDAGASCSTQEVANGIEITCGDGTTAILYSSDGSVKAFARSDLPACNESEVLTAIEGSLSCKSVPADGSMLPLSGGTMTGSIDMGAVAGSIENRIRNMTDPDLAQDAATKAYVDSKTAAITNVQSAQTINVNTTNYITQINNLRNLIIIGDVKLKFADGVYTVPSQTTGGLNNRGLYFNHAFANRISIEGNITDPSAVKFIATTTAQSVLTIAPYTRLARIESVTFESAAGGAISGVVIVQQQGSVTFSNVNIVATSASSSNRAALSVEDGADVVFMNNNTISGNSTSVARGLSCNGQSRVIFSNASGGKLTLSNFSPNLTLPVIDATAGCRVIGNNSSSIVVGPGLTTKPALNTPSTDIGYTGSFIGY